MVSPRSDIQVRRWELEKSYKSANWRNVIDLCDNLGTDLSNVELSYKIRSLYMVKDYHKCFAICNNGQENDKSLLFNICRFQLRSAIALDDKEKITKSLIYFYEKFPSNIEPKMVEMKIDYSLKKYSNSLFLSNEILYIEPDNYIATLFKARNLTKYSMDYEEIKISWENVLSLSNNNVEAMNQLARIAIKQSNFKLSSDLISKILLINPQYQPALNSKDKLLTLQSDKNFINQPLIEDSYRSLYSKSKYSELINNLGGLDNYNNWKLDESTFALRSLNKLKDYQNTINIYLKLMHEPHGPLLNEVIIASEKLHQYSLFEETLTLLANTSRHEVDAMKYYLRHLIYSNMDNSHIANEIRDLLSIHGDSLLVRIIKYVLKSGKYQIIGDIGIGTDYLSILDPIQGSLKNTLSETDYADIWSELDHKVVHAISSNKTSKISYPESFYRYFIKNNTYYPLFRAEDIQDYLINTNSEMKKFSMDEINLICESIKHLSYVMDDNSIDMQLSHLFSATKDEITPVSSNKNIMRFNIDICDNYLFGEKFLINGEIQNSLNKEKIFTDPRLNLGRFFSILKNLDSNTLLSLSWLMQCINDSLPGKLLIHSSLPIAKIAAIMMGYSEDKIIEF